MLGNLTILGHGSKLIPFLATWFLPRPHNFGDHRLITYSRKSVYVHVLTRSELNSGTETFAVQPGVYHLGWTDSVEQQGVFQILYPFQSVLHVSILHI